MKRSTKPLRGHLCLPGLLLEPTHEDMLNQIRYKLHGLELRQRAREERRLRRNERQQQRRAK